MKKVYKQVKLGRSGIKTGNIGFELGPLEHRSYAVCTELFGRAVEAGVTFFDLGMPYEELDKKIGHSLLGTVGLNGREKLALAGSFVPCSPLEFKKQLRMVLRACKVEYLDLCQIHDPDYLPRRGDRRGFYDAMLEAKKAGLIRSIGITTGTETIALHALEFGWYDTLQYPWTGAMAQDDFISFAHEAHMGTISVPPDEIPDHPGGEVLALCQVPSHVQLWPLQACEGLNVILDMVSGGKTKSSPEEANGKETT